MTLDQIHELVVSKGFEKKPEETADEIESESEEGSHSEF